MTSSARSPFGFRNVQGVFVYAVAEGSQSRGSVERRGHTFRVDPLDRSQGRVVRAIRKEPGSTPTSEKGRGPRGGGAFSKDRRCRGFGGCIQEGGAVARRSRVMA